MTQLKEGNKSPETGPRETEMHELLDKEFKTIALLERLRCYKVAATYLNDIRKTKCEQMENIHKT